jgi:hypothetical protein
MTATDLFSYAAQTFKETFAPKLKEWGLKIYPPRRGDYEIEWLIESKSGYLTRIFIVLYQPCELLSALAEQDEWGRAQSLFWRLVGSFLVAPR